MKKIVLLTITVLILFNLKAMALDVIEPRKSFDAWILDVKKEAIGKGISQKTVDEAFKGIHFKEKIVDLDRNQPEVKKTFETYLEQVVSSKRKSTGIEFYADNLDDLKLVSKDYRVPPEFIVALLGVETNYGQNFGDNSIINSLATLAYDKRRSAFFKKELFHALRILDEGHISVDDMKGSWAGAMGQNQFMPSSFYSYAVDYDKDGKKDIWKDKKDVFASTANYLSSYKFNPDEKWGRQVRLPKDFKEDLLGLEIKKGVQEWEKLGVKNKNGLELPTSKLKGSIIAPDGLNGPAYLVYDNFRVFLKWNRSLHFATSVGLLSDAIRDGNK